MPVHKPLSWVTDFPRALPRSRAVSGSQEAFVDARASREFEKFIHEVRAGLHILIPPLILLTVSLTSECSGSHASQAEIPVGAPKIMAPSEMPILSTSDGVLV